MRKTEEVVSIRTLRKIPFSDRPQKTTWEGEGGGSVIAVTVWSKEGRDWKVVESKREAFQWNLNLDRSKGLGLKRGGERSDQARKSGAPKFGRCRRKRKLKGGRRGKEMKRKGQNNRLS